jgi:hypothetical protein
MTSDAFNFIWGMNEIFMEVTALAFAEAGNVICVVSVKDPIMGASANGSLKTGPAAATTDMASDPRCSALIPTFGIGIFESSIVMLKGPGSMILEIKTVSCCSRGLHSTRLVAFA